jgi:hypothetical protein
MQEGSANKGLKSEEVLELIKKRRSVRIFNGGIISKEKIIKIIDAGVWAPTGCNNQELRFLIIDDEDDLKEILKFKPFFIGVSAVILIFCDMSLPMSYKMYVKGRLQKHLPDVDTGLALANMILYAKSVGIDSCIFNLSEYHFKMRTNPKIIMKAINKCKRKLGFHKSIEENFEYYLRRKIKIPKHLKIMCGVAFGYSKVYPDVQKEIHGGKKVMRDAVKKYILT